MQHLLGGPMARCEGQYICYTIGIPIKHVPQRPTHCAQEYESWTTRTSTVKRCADGGAAMRKLTCAGLRSWFASTSGEHAPIDNLKKQGRDTHGDSLVVLLDVSVSKGQSTFF